MYSLIFLGCTSFLLSLLLTPLCRNFYLRRGWVDLPNEARKIHSQPVPRAGGVAIVLSFAGAIGLLLLLPFQARFIIRHGVPLAVDLLPAVMIVFATGLLDDLLGLKPWQKFAGQIAAGALAVFGGLHLHSVGSVVCNHWWAYPLTILWLVGCSNSLNLIDGLDGLAAGIGLFAALTMLVAALMGGDIPLALATAPVVGALLGFLRYNFNPASVFLGDCGSLVIGFLLGCYGIVWCSAAESVFALAAPVIVLAVPILDTFLAIARRFLRRLPIFQADGRHIHHMLLARGLTHRRVAMLLYGICFLASLLSLLQTVLPPAFGPIVLLLFIAGAWLGIRRLKYVEFSLLRRLLLEGQFRGLLNAHISLRSVRLALDKCSDVEECWDVITRSSAQFGFSEIRLRLSGDEYIHAPGKAQATNDWTVRIALPGSGYLNLSRQCAVEPSPAAALYADTLGAVLRKKFAVAQQSSAPRAMAHSAAAGR